MIFVTGGAGFIGSNFVVHMLSQTTEKVLNYDKLTYAGNLENLESVQANPNHIFVRGDIADTAQVLKLFKEHQPRAIIHFAAESHVDRSIYGPGEFIQTNIIGTFSLLQAALEYWRGLSDQAKSQFRFLHVSTDEVYGSLQANDPAFTETTPFAPNSPYSASKASSDHLVRAYFHTYGLPVLTTNCSNNYGPHQFPEKLIPLVISRCLEGKELPIYGDGSNVRDWLHVQDHCEAIAAVLKKGILGETYNIGGESERTNLQVVDAICAKLDELAPRKDGKKYSTQKTFVKDRPGHDKRYAMDIRKIKKELGWSPRFQFENGIDQTVRWYLNHKAWVNNVTSGKYREWVDQNYQQR